MSVHEQSAEDLALYALGALDESAKASIEAHLHKCASCRRELEQLRGDAALLSLSSIGPKPPARAKTRLLDAIAKAPRAQRPQIRAPWWAVLGWVATAAMMVIAATLWQQNARLKEGVTEQAKSFDLQKAQLEKASAMAAILQSPDAERYNVMPVSLKTPPPPSGKAIYSPDRGLVFIASNMNSLPPQKAYELWLIPMQGAPVPAGVFKPDAHGNVAMMHSPMPAGVEAKAFAITIEPQEGSATPTMPIVMMGTGG